MTTVDAIYTRHERALMSVAHADDVVLFSLRLALEELAASTEPTPFVDWRTAERDRAQLARLNDWLAQHEPAAYTLPGDTADAVLSVLAVYRQVAAASSAISNQQSPINNQSPPNPPPAPLSLDLSSLAPDELDQVVTVQSGGRAWRTLPKELRQTVAHLILRQLAAAKGSRLSPDAWDTQRPSWMPTCNAIAQMFECKWTEIPQE